MLELGLSQVSARQHQEYGAHDYENIGYDQHVFEDFEY